MFRAKDVILYKKIRFKFSSEGFVDILKKSIKCIFAYLSFLGKLLKEFRHDKYFWLKITKRIQAWKVCCTNHGFWCAWGVHIPFRNTRSTKNTFSEDIFQKKVEKNIWIPNFEIDQISEFCPKRWIPRTFAPHGLPQKPMYRKSARNSKKKYFLSDLSSEVLTRGASLPAQK